jgi:hypothetical protein
MIIFISPPTRNWNDQIMTYMEPTGLLVETERKDYCSGRLELGFQEGFDRRAVPDIEPRGCELETMRDLQNANQSTFIVRASTSPDTLACERKVTIPSHG